MKIKAIETYFFECPLEKEFHPSWIPAHAQTANRCVILKLITDDGIEGISAASVFSEEQARLARFIAVDTIGRFLIGMDPTELDILTRVINMYGFMLGGRPWFVEVALWDLIGKALNQPVSTLLGGRHHEKLEAYASSIMLMERSEMVKEAKDLVKQGFKKIKVKVGLGVETDSGNIKAIRETVGPDIGIMLDANCGFSTEEALRLGVMVEPLNILWFEEPVPPHDLEGYARLSDSLRIPVVGGESEFTRWGFRDLILRGKVSVIQPDIARCGGFTEARKIAALASSHGVTVAPHTGASGAVSIAAAVHWASSLSNLYLFEHMYTENPLRTKILKEPILEFQNGFVKVPSGPGLGIEIDKNKMKKYLKD